MLVVEDTPDDLDLLAFVLERAAAEVVGAGSVSVALGALERFGPDVVVCDLVFGYDEPDGFDFIRAVRGKPAERGGRVPVLACTAHADKHPRRELLAAGFDELCRTPLDAETLLGIVAGLARRGGPGRD